MRLVQVLLQVPIVPVCSKTIRIHYFYCGQPVAEVLGFGRKQVAIKKISAVALGRLQKNQGNLKGMQTHVICCSTGTVQLGRLHDSNKYSNLERNANTCYLLHDWYNFDACTIPILDSLYLHCMRQFNRVK